MYVEQSYDGDTGTIYTTSSTAVYIPHDVVNDADDVDRLVERALSVSGETPPEAVRIESQTSEPRSTGDRAELLAVLIEQVGPIEFDHTDVNTSNPSSARIPVNVAVAGTAAIACYMAVHGLSNAEIADALDVGQRTVSQYISDFRKGER